jgi:cell shape-determining protein MreC
MRMNYLHNKAQRRRRAAALILLAVLIFAVFLGFGFPDVFKESLVFVSAPLLRAKDSFKDRVNEIFSIFKEKQLLESENIDLRQKIRELEAKLLLSEALKRENKELKEILSRSGGDFSVAASVLSRPPQSPYDVLIIDAGEKHGVEAGMSVSAYGSVFLGVVSEVFKETSRVKLASAPGQKTDVLIYGNNNENFNTEPGPLVLPSRAIGRGNGNFEIILPRESAVGSGDRAMTLGTNPLIMGIVEEVVMDPADAFQKILFRLPVNIQELRWVEVRKGLTN